MKKNNFWLYFFTCNIQGLWGFYWLGILGYFTGAFFQFILNEILESKMSLETIKENKK